MTDSEKIRAAIDIGLEYGWIDGEHHKMWVIDQMLRKLMGDEWYDATCRLDDEWDEGVAP
jgi:hypothetical protein